jgi:hypothetical protein
MTRGSEFYLRTIQTRYVDDAQGILLEEVCRTIDLIDMLAERTATDPKAVAEIRQHRLVLGRLLAQLNLGPEYDIATGQVIGGGTGVISTTSARARHAAQARWAEHRRVRGLTS